MQADDEAVKFGGQLKALRGKVSRRDFAARLGFHENTIGGYERGERLPDWSVITRLRDVFGTDINRLIDGNDSLPDTTGPDLVVLPRYDIRASAGRGALVISEDVSEHFAVGRDWLRRMLPSWAPPNAVVGFLEGGGDSMEPTIRDGDLIMIIRDPEWWVVERGGIFVFTLDHDRLMLKRLQVLMNGDLSIISDNPAYANDTIPMSEVQARVIVHGMVFFSGGRPRQSAR